MSSFLIAAPEALAAASEDLTGIGEAIRAARASAAPATTVSAPAAADEVSAAISRLLGDYAADFQALSARAATFHDGFVQTLLHSASAFAGTEAANGSSLQTLKQDLLGLINAPSYALIGRPLIGPGAPSTPATPMSQNLLVNPGFEVADPSVSGYSGVTIPGWTVTGTPTVIPYGSPRPFFPSPFGSPFPDLPKFLGFPQHAPSGGGNNFAGGGPVATSTISQTVNLTGAAGTPYTLSADLGGRLLNPSTASVNVTFYSSTGAVLGTGSTGSVTLLDRLGFTEFQPRDISGTIPVGTTSAVVTTTFADRCPILGHYNDAYADDVSLTVGNPSLTPAQLTVPTSNVGQIDHVQLIYMENKGVGNIIGSPNAPYINSLINSQDYVSNYYALGHPSDPNYFRVMGGSDFGIAYNPASNVINAPSLMQEMDQKGISWVGYAQGMPFPGATTSQGTYATDALPFLEFKYVFNNTPAYLQTHLLPLTQLSTSLADPNTAPRFAWIAADSANNMEGPIDSPSSVARWALSQVTTHQYNVAAGDAFVQQEVQTIEASPTWNSSQSDVIYITMDEDYNNLSLGFGNEGNHVVMIAIPNQAAIAAGMQPGPVVDTGYANEYSLMATIEDNLDLAPLTANDMYAQPMNGLWK
jgi:PE family/Phosphoesterase family